MKYIPKPSGNKKHQGDGKRGRYVDPSKWITGPDINTRIKYYAYLKHKAQARYRSEPYALTWDDWQTLWTDELFEQRGRRVQDLVLVRRNRAESWNRNNCQICTRREHFKTRAEQRANGE